MLNFSLIVLTVRLAWFLFQAEDGIRDLTVTGVQTCALPIYGIEDLFAGLSGCDGARGFKDPVSEGRFPVIDVRDNRKVPDVSLQIPALPHKTASLDRKSVV